MALINDASVSGARPETEDRIWAKFALGGESTVFSGQVGLTKDAEIQRPPWKKKAQDQPQLSEPTSPYCNGRYHITPTSKH